MHEGSKDWLRRTFRPMLDVAVTAGVQLMDSFVDSFRSRPKTDAILTSGEPCGAEEGSALPQSAGVAGAVREPPAPERGAVPEGHEGGKTPEQRDEKERPKCL